jgi:hypothetical protein
VKPAALAKPEPPKKSDAEASCAKLCPCVFVTSPSGWVACLLAVIRLDELFSKTVTEPPLYFKVNSKDVVEAAREANAKRGGPIFVPEAQLPATFRRGPPRGPPGGLDRQWGGVPRR